jgi:hypothetical protein
LIALELGPVIANRAAAVKPKAYQAVLLMESGFLKAPNQLKLRTFLTTSQIAECADRNLTDSAFRLIGLSFVVLQLPFCLVPELVPSSLRLTRSFGKRMCTGSYFSIRWHSALRCRVPAIFRSIASPMRSLHLGGRSQSR